MSIRYAICLDFRIRCAAEMIYDLVPDHGGGHQNMVVNWDYNELDNAPDTITIEISTQYQPYRGRGVYDNMVMHSSIHTIPFEDLEPDFISEQDHINGYAGGRQWNVANIPYILNLTTAAEKSKSKSKK